MLANEIPLRQVLQLLSLCHLKRMKIVITVQVSFSDKAVHVLYDVPLTCRSVHVDLYM